jgi:hypothetical protein
MLLLAIPAAYFLVSYIYVALWHRKAFLAFTITHENGRLTLAESMLYFDHFIGCVPMVLLFALYTVAGFALSGPVPLLADPARAQFAATVLLGGSVCLVFLSFIAAVYAVGWQQTLDWALQRVERDGVSSKGGTWNQLQLSNVPMFLGILGTTTAIGVVSRRSSHTELVELTTSGWLLLGFALALTLLISASNWCGWQALRNPRWLAHSMRELATYPFTGIPIALASVLLMELYLSGIDGVLLSPGLVSLLLLALCLFIAVVERLLLGSVDVGTIAQRPAFAPNGLPIGYLMASHVFEHFLDFLLIAALSGGVYALLRL